MDCDNAKYWIQQQIIDLGLIDLGISASNSTVNKIIGEFKGNLKNLKDARAMREERKKVDVGLC
jgi:hypothetical protein